MTAKKINRSTEEVVLAGVCGGIAEYFEVDPVLVRLIWLILIFFGTMGIFLYFIAWIIIPKKRQDPTYTKCADENLTSYKRLHRARQDRIIAGICGGLGKHFGIDPVIFRMLALFLFLTFGIGLFIYLLGILFIPIEV